MRAKRREETEKYNKQNPKLPEDKGKKNTPKHQQLYQNIFENLPKLSPRGYPDPLRDPLSPGALLRPRFLTMLTPFWSHFWLPKAIKIQTCVDYFFETLYGERFESFGPLFRELLATILATFWHQSEQVKTVSELSRERTSPETMCGDYF